MPGPEVTRRYRLIVALLATLVAGYLLGAGAARVSAPLGQALSSTPVVISSSNGKQQSATSAVPAAPTTSGTPATYKTFFPMVANNHSGD